MEDNIESALSLLLIGMTTVFVVLSLVVLIGNLLISVINKYFGTESLGHVAETNIDPKKIAVITAAVQQVTEGKGRIEKIEKLN